MCAHTKTAMLKAEPGFLYFEIQPLVQGDGPSLRFVHGAESHPGCIYSRHPARSLSYRISELEGTLGVILEINEKKSLMTMVFYKVTKTLFVAL